SAFGPPGPPQIVPVPGLAATGALDIALLGTSLSARGPWPHAQAERQTACRGGPVTMRRTARAAASSAWAEQAIANALAPQPDLLLIEFAINDAALAHGMTQADSRAHHVRLLDAAAEAGVPVLLMTMNPAWGRNRWLERPGLPAYLALYPDLAAAHGAGLVDTVPAWHALAPDRRAALVPDGLHPTPDGMAVVLIPALETALCPS
ncbi:MAG: SGNH/GDSL hydrolase family protein, partial [Pseudomonadota bacterium]